MIHDSVAAIARQAAYSTSIRESLFGRFWRFLIERINDLIKLLGGSSSARYIVIATVALIVLIVVGRIVVARRLDDQRSRVRAGHGSARARTDYWGLSRELAQAGDYAAACHALYAAVLDSMVRTGAVRFHASKTTGDYSRELARRGAGTAPSFLAFARDFERTVFSTESVEAGDFERLSAAASRVVQPPVAA